MHAVQSKNLETNDMMKQLIEAKADVNKTDTDSVSVLMHAVQSDKWYINCVVKQLIEAGADVNETDKDGVQF